MMTAKQREDLQYIAGWIIGMSYHTDQQTAEGLADIAQCIDGMLNADAEEARQINQVCGSCRVSMEEHL